MSKRLVYFNGEFIPELEARISIFDCDCGLTIDEMEAATLDTVERNLPVLEGPFR